MRFKYQKRGSDEELATFSEEELIEHDKKMYRPSLLVCLRYNNRMSRHCFGLVDTGADMVTAGYKFAYEFGLNPLKGIEDNIQGPWGVRTQYIYENIEVVIIKNMGLQTLAFTTRISFCDAVGNKILLGREGFFDTFKVIINEKHREIELIRTRGQ